MVDHAAGHLGAVALLDRARHIDLRGLDRHHRLARSDGGRSAGIPPRANGAVPDRGHAALVAAGLGHAGFTKAGACLARAPCRTARDGLAVGVFPTNRIYMVTFGLGAAVLGGVAGGLLAR